MSASRYASPSRRGAVVDQLDAVILGATEVDRDFNVNVTTGSHGQIMGVAERQSQITFALQE